MGDNVLFAGDTHQWNIIGERFVRDHDGGGVRSDIPSHPLHLAGDIDQLANVRVVVVKFLEIFALRQSVLDGNLGVVRDQFADFDNSVQRQPQGSANILNSTTGLQGTERSDLSDVGLAVLFLDVANDLTASFLAKVDIDIGCFESAFVEETFEEQIVLDRTNVGQIQRITNQCTDAAAPSCSRHVDLACVANKVPNDQKVVGETELLNDRQLAIQAIFDDLSQLSVAEHVRVLGIASHQPFPT